MNNKFVNINIDDLSHNFSEISDCIKKYYPIGLTSEDENYFSYSGIVALNKIIKKNSIVDYYEKEWNIGFLEKLKSNFPDVYGTTAGLVPNFSGVVRLKNTLESKTELHFYKSLIGNYFTIEVLENIHSKEISHPLFGKRKIWAIENIIVSPVGDYEEVFLKVYQSIVDKYKGVKFLPYIFDLYKVNDLYVPYNSNNKEVTIAGAFFQKFSSYDESITIIGDINYHINRLKKDGDNTQNLPRS
ncbi:hypothetical protein [Flavobacterium sp. MDT1-60]|uniref:hypothetical protein n=1 Tax=Flavobacterium sp. MDT1-60 TaxID=1979344 RepID=UPI00177C6BEC|nr:hypothetical protein [Flavobacterium sp. MDT1-60]QOG04817.1 hypothetical protein IHE43_11755 [Flavobacterium sp. MDT1-60]